MFQVPCATAMLATLCDKDMEIGPTMTIVLAALTTEYSHLVSLSPVQLLSGICHRLSRYQRKYCFNETFMAFDIVIAIVQEPCLLAMLRLAADCEEVPEQAIQIVSEAVQTAGRHIRRVSRMEISCT